MSANFLKVNADQTKLLLTCPSQLKEIFFFLVLGIFFSSEVFSLFFDKQFKVPSRST